MGNLVNAAKSGDRRETLIAIRDKIAATLETSESSRDIPALAKRLNDVLKEIDALPDPNSEVKSTLQKKQAKVKAQRNGKA